MCILKGLFGGGKKTPQVTAPAGAPPPPQANAEVAQASPEALGKDLSENAKRRGRAGLRIDPAIGGVGGPVGLNIPT